MNANEKTRDEICSRLIWSQHIQINDNGNADAWNEDNLLNADILSLRPPLPFCSVALAYIYGADR
jgi:hypothetical protein